MSGSDVRALQEALQRARAENEEMQRLAAENAELRQRLADQQRNNAPAQPAVLDVLALHPPYIRVGSTADSSSPPQFISGTTPEVHLWEYEDSDVLNTLNTHLSGLRLTSMPPPDDMFDNERETNTQFCLRVGRPVEAAIRAMGRRDRLCLERTEVHNCIPDFAIGQDIDDNLNVKMYGEGKFPLVLAFDEGIDLIKAVEDKHIGAVNAVNQISFYLSANGIKYGWLTDYIRTWGVKQVGDGRVYITKAYHCQGPDTTDPPQDISVPQLMMSLYLKAVHEARPAPIVPAGTGGVATHDGTASAAYMLVPPDALILLEELGSGETGIVKAARLYGVDVALKLADVWNSHEDVRQLQHESVAYDDLAHIQDIAIPKQIGRGYAFGGACFYLAIQRLYGAHPVTGPGAIASEVTAAVEALRTIHSAGYAHGDVRRENIIVEQSTGKVLFIDLGRAYKHPTKAQCEAEVQQLLAAFKHSS